MKKIIFSLLIGVMLIISSGCEDWLDVNKNPNGPEKVTAYLYLGAMEQQLSLSMQWDARMLAYYTQNFAYYSTNYAYDRQGTPAWTSDMAEHWRAVYWKLGINLTDMITISEKEERWDLAGIGYAIQAWGWQMLTDMHGPVIYKEAFKPGLYTFAYDEQQLVYEEVVKICEKAIANLNRYDGSVSAKFAGKGDQIYAGNRLKWKKFTYGLLAINMSHLSNKSALYKPEKIMAYVDSAFTSNADNALIGFAGSVSADASFFGPMRGNLLGARPSKFIVSLMDG
ncbi:MAG: SusD/RagB family nutrient-binding outer membrane lipoprotein, partial [Bacteroidota bacterium]|nr:SusD/RagB family nutrient-binding outer membrane lipoprotein [Bacteroidota bacterium]